jgi:hypothetical protein
MRILRRRVYPHPGPLRWPNSADGGAGVGHGPCAADGARCGSRNIGSRGWLHLPLTPRMALSRQPPQGRKAARVRGL